ncbi:serine/threonine-protein kinase [Actinomadura sp. 9N407]|uniref:serine/threonine-protein kinase n=1 Tax=Actinomadura sp. 9N407 TaxID=3375154 RepID=UPI0037BE0C6B
MPASAELRETDPERVGPFQLLGRLGEGGQGVVYLAVRPGGDGEHGGAGGPVAVKRLRAGLGDDPEARARFIRELDTAKRVARFCTAAVLDADVDGDHPYIVSEYVDGPSLAGVVKDQGPRDGGVLERLAVGTATALVAIHQAGVVHRDFKPHNVLLGPDGPRVIDFGIARALDAGTITTSGMGIGTPAYMAPEQLRGERAGPAADVFAWASTMVFASCGRPPFGHDVLDAVAYRILNEPPDLGALDGPLRELAARCLDKDPALRPAAPEVLRTLLGEPEPQVSGPLPPAVLEAAAAVGPMAPDGPATTRPPVPARPERRGVSGVVAVSGAVIAVALAVMVTVLVLSDRGTSGDEDPPRAATPTKTERVTTSPASGRGRPQGNPQNPPGDTDPDPQDPPDEPDRPGFPEAFAGSWSGQVRQNDGKEFLVELTLPKDARQGTVRYPQHGCSGVLTLIGDPGGNALTLRERITSGATACVDTGITTLTRRPDGTLHFSYTGTSQGNTWTVVGTLSRT